METVEQFLARGGRITVCEPQPDPASRWIKDFEARCAEPYGQCSARWHGTIFT